MSTYLYEDTTLNMAILNANGFIFPFPAGSLMVVIRADDSYINFQGVYGNQPFRQNTNGHILPDFVPATDILKQNGDAYATAAEIMSTMKSYLAGSQSSGSQFETFEIEITRPIDTTAYAAGDVVADVGGAFLPLTNVAKAIGTGVKIIRCRIQTSDTNVAGKKFNLHLYKEAPTFIPNNDQFAISYANATKRKGAIPIVMGTGNLGTVGMNDYNPIVINPTARDIFYMLEAVDAFTPSANSTKFTICIDCELSN